MSDDDVPEIPDLLEEVKVGDLVSIDATLLARQNQHIARLNKTIGDLATAIRERPTKREIQRARRRTFMVATVMVLIASFLFGWLFVQQQKLHDQCEDRNRNAAQFRVLLELLLNQDPVPGSPPLTEQQKKINQAFIDYKNSLTPIKC